MEVTFESLRARERLRRSSAAASGSCRTTYVANEDSRSHARCPATSTQAARS